jgi:hypothetical protein
MDEVPDSSWFANRIGVTPMSIDDIARGPNQIATLNVDGWPITQQKSAGVTPGFRMKDPTGHIYQLKFDPPTNPEMSSGAEVIGAAIYNALGYNVVQGYIVELDPAKIVVDPNATMVDMSGNKRLMMRADVDDILKHAAKSPNGKYRALASRFAEGRPAGYFKYYGTRPDDPNDIFLHEHRRELRGNRVFSAWLNHDDSRALNSLDMLVGDAGKQSITHYMFDFGSILGSGSTVPNAPRGGNEYLLEWKPGLLTLATLGLYFRPWIMVDYPDLPRSLGRIEADYFDPLKWKAGLPQPGVRQHAARRRVLGGTARGAFLGRGHSRGRQAGAVLGSARRTAVERHHHQAPRQGVEGMADGCQSDRQRAAVRGWNADLRERRGGGGRGDSAFRVRPDLGALR